MFAQIVADAFASNDANSLCLVAVPYFGMFHPGWKGAGRVVEQTRSNIDNTAREMQAHEQRHQRRGHNVRPVEDSKVCSSDAVKAGASDNNHTAKGQESHQIAEDVVARASRDTVTACFLRLLLPHRRNIAPAVSGGNNPLQQIVGQDRLPPVHVHRTVDDRSRHREAAGPRVVARHGVGDVGRERAAPRHGEQEKGAGPQGNVTKAIPKLRHGIIDVQRSCARRG